VGGALFLVFGRGASWVILWVVMEVGGFFAGDVVVVVVVVVGGGV
jgi:hypothetical protein